MLKTPILMNTIFHNNNNQSRESPPLSSLFPNNSIFDLDATIASSYSSGQTWKNIIAAPADGAAKNAYDFNLGANATVTTDDPIDAGTRWQVGSTRLTPDMITELKKTVSVKAEKIITSFKSAKALADKVATKTALKGV